MSGPFDFGNEHDDLPELLPTENDGQPFPHDSASSDNREVSDETQPRHYDIIPQDLSADLIIECEDETTFLVSSAVLRLGSDYFKKLLYGEFKEGQATRSAINPQTISEGEKDSDALRRLFCLLHHHRDPDSIQHRIHLAEEQDEHSIAAAARRLQDLAVVTDYYGCSESLDRVVDSLLNDFVTPSIRDRMTYTATVHVTSAAYILDNPRHFRLFTKRLLTDYTEPLGDANFAKLLSDHIISKLEDQSRQLWYRLKVAVTRLAQCQCTRASIMCLVGGKDRLLVDKLTDCLLPPGTAWPLQRGDGIAIRHLLGGLYNLERMQRVAWCEHHEQQIHDTVGPDDFRRYCQEIDNTDTLGLCLPCTKKSDSGNAGCDCSENEKRRSKEWVRGDSFALDTVLLIETDKGYAGATRQRAPTGRNTVLPFELVRMVPRADGP